VLHLNTLDWANWDETAKQNDWMKTYCPGWFRLLKLRADEKSEENRVFNFDILIANPPFAGDIKQKELLTRYILGSKENGKVGRDLLFIERNLDSLKPGGRMAVVLPQGRFNNSERRKREGNRGQISYAPTFSVMTSIFSASCFITGVDLRPSERRRMLRSLKPESTSRSDKALSFVIIT
jgi:hypothetical protein